MGWLEDRDLVSAPLGLGELPLVREALQGYRDALNELGQRWYIEVTADPDGARGLDFIDFSNPDHPSIQRLDTQLTMLQISEGARRVAEERAGWRSPGDPAPSDPKIASVAAFYRREYALADEFERRLARVLGPTRGRELRRSALVGHTRRQGCP
jgi:hypothetical protein